MTLREFIETVPDEQCEAECEGVVTILLTPETPMIIHTIGHDHLRSLLRILTTTLDRMDVGVVH